MKSLLIPLVMVSFVIYFDENFIKKNNKKTLKVYG